MVDAAIDNDATTTSLGVTTTTISNYEAFVRTIPNKLLVMIPLVIPSCLLLFHIISLGYNHHHQSSGITVSTSRQHLVGYIIISIIGYYMTQQLIPHISQYTLRKNIYGKDLGKRNTKTADIPIPEALGIVPGAVFLVCLILCLVGFNSNYTTMSSIHPTSSSTSRSTSIDSSSSSSSSSIYNDDIQNLYKILEINTSLLAICFMLFLGFTDDVLDWPWRYKLILPTIASLPIITCYTGSTIIVIPKQLRCIFWNTSQRNITTIGTIIQSVLGIQIDPYSTQMGTLMDLKYIYLIYMSMLAVFCTNAINIYAGINGLEVGQSYIIACSILIYNCIEIILLQQQQQQLSMSESSENIAIQEQNIISIDHHIFSIMVIVCFIGVTIGLLYHNWYPAKVFVGDTYCYFAGMTFAVVGIFGHYSKTLLLFFIPQIINFIWSTPQLFHIVPCPRHRLPSFNSRTGFMEPSTFPCKPQEYQWLKRIGYQNPNDTYGVNMTMINICLQLFGPMSERTLCISLLLFQIICCGIGFLLRYYVARFFF